MENKGITMGKGSSLHLYEEGELLHIVVDTSKELGPSASGKTTLIAAMALDPIHWPTKMVSISIFSDITRIPIEAGIACWISNLGIGRVPKSSAESFFI
mgnify:CR=1 FL=1